MLGALSAVFMPLEKLQRLDQGSETFSIKSLIVNILGFVGHMLSAAATQVCCHSEKAAIHNVQRSGHGSDLLEL